MTKDTDDGAPLLVIKEITALLGSQAGIFFYYECHVWALLSRILFDKFFDGGQGGDFLLRKSPPCASYSNKFVDK